jgi:citrate synthase
MSGHKKVEDAELRVGNKVLKLPVYEGAEGERGIDISNLRAETGHITFDTGLANSGTCMSSITYIDGEKGILRYRGIPIEELAEKSSFLEVAYLVVYGKLPVRSELDLFTNHVIHHTMLHEGMKRFFEHYPEAAHPMSILSAMICSLSSYYPDCLYNDPKFFDINVYRIIAKAITIAAFSYKKSIGQPFIGPLNKLGYVENFLRMMFSVPAEDYELCPTAARALEMILILHADHEQNCSTSTVRTAGSSQANIYASISAGICALWGYLHGGANQSVIEMLQHIKDDGGNVKRFIDRVKNKDAGVRLMGFGHRVYKNFDPRSQILKRHCDQVLSKVGKEGEAARPLLELAMKLEEAAVKDEYFLERKLYPNVDFYSGIILRAIGIPVDMFTVIFAIGRMPGWIAQWKEMRESPNFKISRPRQIYVGHTKQPYIPIEQR